MIDKIIKDDRCSQSQAINYLEAYGIADGLLINFGGVSLEFKRVYNKNMRKVLNTIEGLKD